MCSRAFAILKSFNSARFPSVFPSIRAAPFVCYTRYANAAEHELEAVFDTLTPTELRKLRAEMELVKRRGYATDQEENEPGVACIGAPIVNESGASVGALSISGPSVRILKQEREIGTVLAATCKEISRQMGFSDTNLTQLAQNRGIAFRRAST